MKTKFFSFLSASLLAITTLLSSQGLAQELAPEKQLSDTIDKILEVVQKLPGDGQATARRAQLGEVIKPHFDFAEMSKRSLGSYWSKATPDEKKEFVAVFSDLLSDTYLSKIETVQPGMVKIEGADTFPDTSTGTKRSVVKTKVTNKGDVFPINYKLYSKGTGWKVYDVIIENIGLVANYRTEFAGIIRKDGISGLIKQLKSKSS